MALYPSKTAYLKRVIIGTVTRGKVAVGTTSTEVLGAYTLPAFRRYVILCNDSDTVIYLSIDLAAVVGEGIRLNANGGSYEMSELNMSMLKIYAIHGGTGTKNLTYLEGK